ncbi:hypothetical protein FRC03_001888 [Tulasnella sp. 419]|nr:hypothetical protein FRC03_001888 [Tulasnella sp. 419]
MAKTPSKTFFNAVEFNELFKWMKIHPHFVKKTPLTADEIVRWDIDQISKESMHPLVNRDTDEDKAKVVCDPQELFYRSAW